MTGDPDENRRRGQAILEKIREGFPSPFSSPMHDAYVGFTVMKVLDRLDSLKGQSHFLGEARENDYARARDGALDEGMRSVESMVDLLAGYLPGADLFAHPLQQFNVAPPTTLPSLLATLITSLLNPNLLWDDWSRRFAEAEVEVSALLSEWVGYDKSRSVGISTYGGSGATLYGVRMMVAKAVPGAAEAGLREDVKIVASDAAHSCKYNALEWLGIGRKNLVTVPTDEDNCLLPAETLEIVYDLLDRGEKLGGFICTMGTTDAFGMDDITFVAGLRDQVVKKYRLDYVPHLHADAVIGWPYRVFHDYDFDANPLGFTPDTLKSVRDTGLAVENLHLADSVGIDFHKTGYAPCISTFFLLKEKEDLRHIHRTQEVIPYLFQAGNYRPGLYTLELSRSASGVFSALANLRFFGKDGYRVLLSHPIEMANRLRRSLGDEPTAVVLNRYNFGPVTLFRLYPPGVNAAETYEAEIGGPGAAGGLERHNAFNREIYLRIREESRQGKCANLSLTTCYRKTPEGRPIFALKSFIMTPFVTPETMDTLVSTLLRIRDDLCAQAADAADPAAQ